MERLIVPQSDQKPGQKLLVMMFGYHDKEHLHEIDDLKERITTMLDSAPKGEVAVFIEDANVSRHGQLGFEGMTARLKKGWLPSDAYVGRLNEYGIDRRLDPETIGQLATVKLWRRKTGYVIPERYLAREYEVLDEIASGRINPKHKRRIHLVSEGNRTFTGIHRIHENVNGTLHDILKKASEGVFDDNDFRENLSHMWWLANGREHDMQEDIKVAMEQPVIGGVSLHVESHGRMATVLSRDDRLHVTVHFPEGLTNEYIQDPISATISEKDGNYATLQDFMSDEECRLVFTQTLAWRALSEKAKLARSQGKPVSEQRVRSVVWDRTRDMTDTTVMAFRKSVQDNGLKAAMQTFMRAA